MPCYASMPSVIMAICEVVNPMKKPRYSRGFFVTPLDLVQAALL